MFLSSSLHKKIILGKQFRMNEAFKKAKAIPSLVFISLKAQRSIHYQFDLSNITTSSFVSSAGQSKNACGIFSYFIKEIKSSRFTMLSGPNQMLHSPLANSEFVIFPAAFPLINTSLMPPGIQRMTCSSPSTIL